MKYICIVGAENCPQNMDICCYSCEEYGTCESDAKCITADAEKFERCEYIEVGNEP